MLYCSRCNAAVRSIRIDDCHFIKAIARHPNDKYACLNEKMNSTITDANKNPSMMLHLAVQQIPLHALLYLTLYTLYPCLLIVVMRLSLLVSEQLTSLQPCSEQLIWLVRQD